MKEEKDKLRDFMQEAFKDYEVAPDPEDWDRIEKTLRKGKGKRYIMWAFWPVAASLLILLGLYTGGVLSHSDNTTTVAAMNHTSQGKQTAASTKSTIVPEKKILPENTDKIITNKDNSKRQLSTNQPTEKTQQLQAKSYSLLQNRNNHHLTVAILKKEAISQPGHQQTVKSTDSMSRIHTDNSYIQPIKPHLIASINQNTSLKPEISKEVNNILPDNTLLAENKKDIKQNIASSLRFKGLSLNNSNGAIIPKFGKQDMGLFDSKYYSQLATVNYFNAVSAYDNSFLSTEDIGSLYKKYSHTYIPPVTFGLNINLSLQGNWSIETGLQYTKLQSNGQVAINPSKPVQFITSFIYKVDESLYYLGVPFIISYNFSQKRKTSFYMNAGFSIEKGIIAKYKATPLDNFPGMKPFYSQNAIKGLQYSSYGGIGISYKFIPHFELFTQPSIIYYFKPQGNSSTIYSIHPWLFNLRSGIRYSIK